MRLERKWLLRAGIVLCCGLGNMGQASAQGFFQQLFGFSAPPAAEPPSQRPQSTLTPGGRPYTLPNQSSPRRSTDDDDDRSSKTGTLKTVCVRMCDGYYFPVSNATSKKGLFRDQMKCRSACGDEARLFHLPAGSIDVGEATDGHGRTYGLLNVAYKYRKGLVAGCQCRPAPWSEAETARHQQYAETEAAKAAAEKAQASKIAAATPGEPATDAKPDAKPTVATAAVARSEDASQKPTKLAGTSRPTSSKSTSQARRGPAPTTAPNFAQAPKPAPTGVMSLGGGGLQWPGDQPRR